jgi:hypothetical protein
MNHPITIEFDRDQARDFIDGIRRSLDAGADIIQLILDPNNSTMTALGVRLDNQEELPQ